MLLPTSLPIATTLSSEPVSDVHGKSGSDYSKIVKSIRNISNVEEKTSSRVFKGADDKPKISRRHSFSDSIKSVGNTNHQKDRALEVGDKPVFHDTNFNNTKKTIEESWAASVILKNPEYFGDSIYELAGSLAKIIIDNPNESFFLKTISDDASKLGQFARVDPCRDEMIKVLESGSKTPELFAKKILLIKSFGAYIIDHAQKRPDEHKFITTSRGTDLQDLVLKWRPSDIFETRGRTGVKSKAERYDIGIMDKNTLSNIKDPEHFKIQGLSKERPLFRTFINDKSSGRSAEFIEKTFDRDEPLVGAVSGSTSCIMVASELLKKGQIDNKQLALSASAFLVGGGYHSQAEVMQIACPGMTMHDGIRETLPKPIYDNCLLVLNKEMKHHT